MALLTVIALYDRDLNFFPSGKQFTIPADSQIGGIRELPTGVGIPGTTDYSQLAPMLIIKTTEFGDLYLNQTADQYLLDMAIQGAAGGPAVKMYQFIQPGSTNIQIITAPQLFNVKIDKFTVGNTIVTDPFTYSSDYTAQTGTMSIYPAEIHVFVPTLVTILYH